MKKYKSNKAVFIYIYIYIYFSVNEKNHLLHDESQDKEMQIYTFDSEFVGIQKVL